jgi:ornithine--oxo-acid transaminase
MSYRANIYDPIPVSIVEGHGCWVTDDTGTVYLDCLAGYSAVSHGHCHHVIVKAAIEQMKKLCLISRAFDAPLLHAWEKKMCETFDAKMVLPMNSGAEGVETAIKIARKWGMVKGGIEDGKQQIVVCDGNFHGRTTTIISFSPNDNYRSGFGPLTPGFISIPYGDHNHLYRTLRDNPNVIAFLVEPLQGEGGMNVPPEDYFAKVRQICNDMEVLLILDEVQTGLGRTGYLLGEEAYGIKADLTILGKALGGGIVPISCVLDRPGGIMDILGPGDHGSTWGGNPLACAVSMVALDVLKNSNMITNSKAMGLYLLDELKRMGLNARGKGLMIGIETPPGTSRSYCLKLKEQGILVKDAHGVVRITPPLIITLAEVQILLAAMERVFKQGGRQWQLPREDPW